MKTVISVRGMAALALVGALAVVPAEAQQPTTPQQPQQKEHVVRKGDTLWDLAREYLSDPFRWPMIYDANKNVVENPHWIYPAEKLIIPGMPADAALLGTPVDTVILAPASARSRFYTPPAQGSQTVITSEIARIPLVQPLEWLAAPWIGDSATLGINAGVFKPADPRYVNDKLPHIFHPRDRMYLTTEGSSVKKDDRLLAVRLTRNLRGFGWVIEPQGILRVDSLGTGTAVATLVNEFGDLRVGDVAIPLPAVPAMPEDRLIEVTGGPTGEIIEFLVEQPLYATTDYAFVNIGAQKGIALGDEILAFMPRSQPSSEDAGTVPEESVAKMRVIRVTEQTATVRVTRLNNASLGKGVPVRVARKAP